MRIFNKILVFFYTLIFSIIGAILIFIAFHLSGKIDLSEIFNRISDFPNLPIIFLLSGILLILVSLSLASISYKKFQAEKTIGYSTADGQVIISLGAIEDFIRRLNHHMSEVKELRSEVLVTRRGIEIESRVILWAASNIPEITEKVQAMIRGQVQELLSGIEKPIMVNVLVTKIDQKEQDPVKKHKQELPFIR
ncbi:MAG: alkaline shock response membrane anchor protein AmaP [Candidatus Omnitrophica bacterium]|nr:alkaline shock response membrane anchor protein AmaP [Candidatus Omnitrophota bacterium]